MGIFEKAQANKAQQKAIDVQNQLNQAVLRKAVSTSDFITKGNGTIALTEDSSGVVTASNAYTVYHALYLSDSIKAINFTLVKNMQNYVIIAGKTNSDFIAVELNQYIAGRVYQLSELSGPVMLSDFVSGASPVNTSDNISVYDDSTNFVFLLNGYDWFTIPKTVINVSGFTQKLGLVFYNGGVSNQIYKKMRTGIFNNYATTVSDFSGKKLSCLGDSITYGTGLNAGEKQYHAILKDRLGFKNVTNLGVHGTEISTGGTWGASTAFVSRYTDIPLDSDYIIVFGGTNDYLHNVTLGTIDSIDSLNFYGALNNLCANLYDRYPNARIIFVTPIRTYDTVSGNTDKALNTKGNALSDYVNAIKAVCANYATPVIDLHTTSGFVMNNWKIRDKVTSDGIHPNQYGHQRIANTIQTSLITYR